MSDDLMERVIKVISETARVPRDKIAPESTFQELGMDSLDAVQLLFGLENEFDLELPDDAAEKVKNVRELAAGIDQLLGEKQRGETAATA